jgi:transcriptional regulator with PAS, ATPase and Fis domain
VLARELNLNQIRDIHQATDATIEFFIHGALCVAYSGQCNISHAQTGRSANRGDCSQACRLPYTLKDDQGRVVAFEKHLLSMKDNDQTANLAALIDAGVRSFKILVISALLSLSESHHIMVNLIMAEFKETLLGEANSFLEVLEQVSRLAPLNKPVLIIGERG